MSPVVLTAHASRGTLIVSLAQVSDADHQRVCDALDVILPRLGMPQDLGGIGDEIHVLVEDGRDAVGELTRLCGAIGIAVHDVTPSGSVA